jgi:hypothetical protein
MLPTEVSHVPAVQPSVGTKNRAIAAPICASAGTATIVKIGMAQNAALSALYLGTPKSLARGKK